MESSGSIFVTGHKITPVDHTGGYDMVIGETPAQVQGPPPHFHSKINEIFFVLEGEMEFILDGKTRHLKKGDYIDLPLNAIHTFRNPIDAPCKWINIHSPSGFLAFFKKIGVPVEEENAFEKSVAESVIQEIMKSAADYDMHIRI